MNAFNKCLTNHLTNADGTPTGGMTSGTGFTISWQNGALGRGAERKEPNGAFVETIIAAAMDRLAHYQASKFACDENHAAIGHLRQALAHLEARTKAREARTVEGIHTP